MSLESSRNTRSIVIVFGLWLFAMMFCNDMTNYGSIHVGINIRLDRIIYGVLIVLFLSNGERMLLSWNTEERLMLLLFVICLGSCIIFGAINAPNNRYLAQLINFTVLPAVLYGIARRTRFDIPSIRLLSQFFKAVGVYLAFTAVFEHYEVSSLIFPKYILDPWVGLHFGRSRGPFGSAVVMGGALTLTFFWVFWQQMHLSRGWANILILLLFPVSIYFTETRSVWIFFGVALFVSLFFAKELRKPFYWAITLLVLFYFSGIASKFSVYEPTLFSRRQGPVDDRKNILNASRQMFLDNPVFGFGYGNFLKYSAPYFTEMEGVEMRGQGEGQHNTPMGLLTEVGLVGTIPYFAVFFMLFVSCTKVLKSLPREYRLERSIAATQFATLSGFLVYMQFSDVRYYNFVNCLIFWMSGVIHSLSRRSISSLGPANQRPSPA